MSTKKGNQLFDLGIKLYDLEIDNRAETVFTECIRLNIKPDTSLFKLGNVLLRGNKLEEGIKCFKQAIKYNPGYLKAIFNLGATYYDNLQFQESVFYYQMADKIKPNDDRIVYGIAASQYALEQFDLSLENCKRVLLLNKDHENAKVLLRMLKEAKN
jgi:tetratricopeptide (TPR) repeat protein